jgi:hypothetical protein
MNLIDALFGHLTKPEVTADGQTTHYDNPALAAIGLAKASARNAQPIPTEYSGDLESPIAEDTSAAPSPEPTMSTPSFLKASSGPTGISARNPGLTKKGALEAVLLGGLFGGMRSAGAKTFGEGFENAEQAPIQLAGAKLGVERAGLQNEQLKAQTNLLKNTIPVTDPVTHATYHIPQGQLPSFLRTNITEAGKNSRNTQNVNSREGIALRNKGLKLDDNGNQVPIPYEELSPTEQAAIDLKQSQQEAAQAKADLDKAKNDPTAPAYKAAYGRLLVAQKNAETAAGRLGLEGKKYMADYFGVDEGGQALPGTPTDEETGRPIGPRVANAGNTSADRLRRADLARNASTNIAAIKKRIDRSPDLFGKVAGRFSNLAEMSGTGDEDLAALATEIHNLALASNGAHGIRSGQAIHDTENVILNRFHNSPEATKSALDAMDESLATFKEDAKHGKRPTPDKTKQADKKNKYSDLGVVILK